MLTPRRPSAKAQPSRSIYGSGLVATAMQKVIVDPCTVIYAAGVSNSQCVDPWQFERERAALGAAVDSSPSAERFVYFGTCSVLDPSAAASAYVRHKIAMEAMVRSRHPGWLILRMPQLAGATANPHTLLNYLYQRISRSEKFSLQAHATRNVIDVDDAARIARELICGESARRETINIAAARSLPVVEIVEAMARLVGKTAIYDRVDAGATYSIDTTRISAIARHLGICFDESYLERALRRYYPPPS